MASKLIVDIGNSSISIARFAAGDGPGLPTPSTSWYRPNRDLPLEELLAWVPTAPCEWIIGSVHRPTSESLSKWITARRTSDTQCLLDHRHFPMTVDVDRPDRVGIDRLAAAFAANAVRDPEAGAIVIDTGSATTVDLISPAGVFLGGSIFPGIQLSLRSLAEHTDLLPALEARRQEYGSPSLRERREDRAEWDLPFFGKNTEQAMFAGVYWSAVEGIRGIVRHLQSACDYRCQVIGTGGDMAGFLPHLGDDVQYEPHLVLAGMWLATRQANQERPT